MNKGDCCSFWEMNLFVECYVPLATHCHMSHHITSTHSTYEYILVLKQKCWMLMFNYAEEGFMISYTKRLGKWIKRSCLTCWHDNTVINTILLSIFILVLMIYTHTYFTLILLTTKMLIVYNFVAKLELATHTFFSYPTPSLPKPTPCSRDCFPDHGIPAPYHGSDTVLFRASTHPHTTPHHPILTVLWFLTSSV